jgi:hypothetical protein
VFGKRHRATDLSSFSCYWRAASLIVMITQPRAIDGGVNDGEDLQKVKFLLCELTFSFAWLNEAEDAAVVAAAEDQIWVSLLNV